MTHDVYFLKSGIFLKQAFLASLEATALLSSKSIDIDRYLQQIVRLGEKTEQISEFIEVATSFANEAYRRDGTLSEQHLKQYFGLSRSQAADKKGNALRTVIKVLLLFLYKHKAILLPYEFSRPVAPWIDKLSASESPYCEVVLSFRSLDVMGFTGAGSRLEHSPAERKNRRLFQMATKIALASTWNSPEDISLNEILEWRTVQKTHKTESGNLRISPIPLLAICEQLDEFFSGRLSFLIDDARKKLSTVARAVKTVSEDYLAEAIGRNDTALATVISVAKNCPSGIRSFSYDEIDGHGIVRSIKEAGWDCEAAYSCWTRLEKKFMEFMDYETPQSWFTPFGRLNLYLFVYLPLWFLENPTTELLYPSAPNKFVGRLYYRCKFDKTKRPLSLVEFFFELNYAITYESMGKYRLFFDFLIEHSADLVGCSDLKQPISWLPKPKNLTTTTKESFSGEMEVLFANFLLAMNSMASYVQEHADAWVMAKMREKSQLHFISLEGFGYTPIVLYRGKWRPIISYDCRALLFESFRGKSYFNPASFTFPFCLLRGGLRGQNLQWLDAETYDQYSHRRGSRGVDVLLINTDKIKTSPFTVLCRSSVISMLDEQRAWRDYMISEGCSAFGYPVFYDGNSNSKWGKIDCLFASNTETGFPITDSAYSNLWLYSQLSFQQWLRGHDISDELLVSLIPAPKEKTGGTNSYEWGEWHGVGAKPGPVVVQELLLTDGSTVEFCPVSMRAKITPHGARATHMTLLIESIGPEEARHTTGQTIGTASYYDTGQKSLMSRFEGTFNNQEGAKRVVNPVWQHGRILPEILQAKEMGRGGDIAGEFNLISMSHSVGRGADKKDGLQIIASDKNVELVESSTHICTKGLDCPPSVIEDLKGRGRCSWCSLAVFSLNFIFAVSAKRRYLAEELARLQRELEGYAVSGRISDVEIRLLEIELNQKAQDVVGWYLVEQSLDAMLAKRKNDILQPGYVARDKDKVVSLISKYEVRVGSTDDFLRRLSEVCEFPNTTSRDFQDKIGRAIRLLLAQKGELFRAVSARIPDNPELHLAAMIRDRFIVGNLELDKFVSHLELNEEKWIELVSQERDFSERINGEPYKLL